MTWRGFLIAKSYRLNFIGTYFGGALYVLFYFVLARFIGTQPASVKEFGDYFTYLLIGGVFARYLSSGMKFLSRELEHEMVNGTVEPLMVTATSSSLTMLGPSAWMFVEGIILMMLQMGMGALFFGADLSRANWVSAVVATLLSLSALYSWGILSVAFLIVFKRADPVNWLIDLTTFVFCGVYFPITVLPEGLRIFSYMLPLTYSLQALRGALMQGQSLYELRLPLFALVLFNLILIPLCFYTFRRAITYTKRTGSLGQY